MAYKLYVTASQRRIIAILIHYKSIYCFNVQGVGCLVCRPIRCGLFDIQALQTVAHGTEADAQHFRGLRAVVLRNP